MMWPNAWRVSALFVREWVGRPAAVGALCPSSRQLAREMADAVPDGDGLVVELGGGTGAITAALLERGVAPRRLVVVERSPAFVQHLRRRFPGISIVSGDARQLERLLPPDARVDAIVSCLPLRTLPRQDVTAIVGQCHRVLSADGVMIQFTYDLRPPGRHPFGDSAFVACDSRIVWANIPPARIVTVRNIAAEHAE
ncbi:methyltransferase [Burkholderia cepacia]|uniref:class I SAM-dependent methyltransferase n=1 Tax=Burkholderia cepacia TaxID=292 RepID=UPI00075CB513|nr:methyltransferase domain-containing protein [Burkholderia cepacia]KVA53370.1 methyltransferase [Burkholderia cepacia]KVA59000.1 methyltransferase [Burkholderia cepacia]KVA63603.1 methyltransferase [Burkholderia cepacia]KVA85993.1 methyltransferase [Burkholderia cepacia]KVA88477.1 methyltransferase [Burkholderia cepacia]